MGLDDFLAAFNAVGDLAGLIPIKAPQQVSWEVEPLEYGQPLSELARIDVRDGNTTDAPAYTPPLDDTIWPAGIYIVMATLAEDTHHQAWTEARPVHIRPRPLTVIAPNLDILAGADVPEIAAKIDGLHGDDAIEVTFEGLPTDPTPGFYRLDPTVAFTHGSARNYAAALMPGSLVVHPGPETHDSRIKALRDRILDLDRAHPLLDELDRLIEPREAGDDLGVATLLAALEYAVAEEAYVPVQHVVIDAPPVLPVGGSIEFTTRVLPENATDPRVEVVLEKTVLATRDGSTLTHENVDGGIITLRAFARCRRSDCEVEHAIRVMTPPEEVIGPDALEVFMGIPADIGAHVHPPSADQALRYRVTGKAAKHVQIDEDGRFVVADNKAQPQNRQFEIVVAAAHAPDDAPVVKRIPVTYEWGTREIEMTHSRVTDRRGKRNEPGEEVVVTATIQPKGAMHALKWSCSEGLEILGTSKNRIRVRPEIGGVFRITATADDGTACSQHHSFRVFAPVEGLAISNVPETLDISEQASLEVTLSPPGVRCHVSYSSNNEQVLWVDKGRVIPVGPGTATVTATAQGFEQSVEITVTGDDNSPVTTEQWRSVSDLAADFALRIGLGHGRPLFEYLNGLEARVRGGEDVNLGAVRSDLIALRNETFQLTDDEWLFHAGFGSNGASHGCFETTYRGREIHITMFPVAGRRLAIGNDVDALFDTLFRRNSRNFVSLHASYDNGGASAMKAFYSGERHGSNGRRAQALREDIEQWLATKVSEIKATLASEIAAMKSRDHSPW